MNVKFSHVFKAGVLFFAFISAELGMSQEESKLFEEFQQTSQQKWREYLLSHDGWEIEYKLESYFNAKLDSTTYAKMGLRFPNMYKISKLEYTDDFIARQKKGNPEFNGDNTEEYLHLVNLQYDARLEKSASDDWGISQLEPILQQYVWEDLEFQSLGEQPLNVRTHAIHTVLSSFAPGISLDAATQVPWLMRLPQFRIVKVEDVFEEKTKCLKISYTIDLTEAECLKYRMDSSSGSFTFIPGYWVLRRAEYVKRSLKHQIEYDYDKSRVEFPLLTKKLHTISGAASNPWVIASEWNYVIQPLQDQSGKCFTLSGYGFPEPDFGGRRASPFRYTLAIIGILLVAFALWRMWRRRCGLQLF